MNKSDNSISVLDAATGKLKWTAPVESGPHEAEVLADGKTAAVSDYGRAGAPGRVVALIDLATGKVDSRVDLGEGSRPHGLTALRDGRLLVTAEGKRELVVVDPRSARVTARIPTGHDLSHMVAASPDGKRAYVTSLRSGVVTVIDVPGGKVVGDIPTGKGAEGLDVTPDGREIWVANREANTISVIDAKTREGRRDDQGELVSHPRAHHARRQARPRLVHGLGRRRRLRRRRRAPRSSASRSAATRSPGATPGSFRRSSARAPRRSAS